MATFFGGLFAGIKEGFSAFAPVGSAFNVIAESVKTVLDWLMRLFEPIKLTSDEFSSLAAAVKAVGKVIGTVLAGAVKLVLLPLEALISGLKWLKGLVFGEDKATASSTQSRTEALPIASNSKSVTNNNQPTINITVPPGSDVQGIAAIAREEVQRALEDHSEMGWMYD